MAHVWSFLHPSIEREKRDVLSLGPAKSNANASAKDQHVVRLSEAELCHSYWRFAHSAHYANCSPSFLSPRKQIQGLSIRAAANFKK